VSAEKLDIESPEADYLLQVRQHVHLSPHRYQASDPPKNELEIIFALAYDKSEALRALRGHLLCWYGHYGRVYVRKAQYHFGWD
jgi:hypothetical protein